MLGLWWGAFLSVERVGVGFWVERCPVDDGLVEIWLL